ncbi:S8 family serine peptidase [bacterium]|nr:S8 family serine peptidase [bacterium]
MRRPLLTYMPLLLMAAACLYLQLLSIVLLPGRHLRSAEEIAVVPYDAAYPQLEVLEDRVLAETRSGLSELERAQLWREHGLRLTFEWVNPDSGFTYHELDVLQPGKLDGLLASAGIARPHRELRDVVEELDSDPRVNWAAPDALLMEWNESSLGAEAATAALDQQAAMFINDKYQNIKGGLAAWEQEAEAARQDPMPLFEYYRLCDPQGTTVDWAEPLSGSELFMQGNAVLFGNGEASSFREYGRAGNPELSPVTVCVADTGIFVNHPDLSGRMHPDALDANYRNYRRIGSDKRPGNGIELTDREDERGTGLPREAIQGRPAGHGTSVAGLITRCTADYETGNPGIRILPASVKSESTFRMVGYKVKSPISAFIKLVNALSENYPVMGDSSSWGPDGQGEVRVVSVSASVPKAFFSEAEWKVVANVVGKASGSIWEDVSRNDRLYVFAAGNEAQGVTNKPGEEDYVLSVSACMPADPSRPWLSPASAEGSNLEAHCVSAPGYGLVTSRIYPHPNLSYLPSEEFREGRFVTVPQVDFPWSTRTSTFSATSGATPQVSALAALLYAQDPTRRWEDVRQRIIDSTAGRKVTGEYGESMGLIDYAAALDWGRQRGSTEVQLNRSAAVLK